MEQATSEAFEAAKPQATSSSEVASLLLREIRPKQWLKNLIVYAPLLFSGRMLNDSLFLSATLTVIAFCCLSSCIYIVNDIIDVESDRKHPTKCKRPIASGKLNVRIAVFAASMLGLSGFALCYLVRPSMLLIFLGFIALNAMYVCFFRNHAILDVMSIAASFVIRALAGACAVYVVPSSWFLLCTTLGALYIALKKRRHEINLLADAGGEHRKSLVNYSNNLLSRLEGLIVSSLLTAYAFYSFQSEHGQWLMLTVPIVLYGLMRYEMLCEKAQLTGSPEEVVFRDRPIQATVLLWVLTCAMVVYGNPTAWIHDLAATLDGYSFNGNAGGPSAGK